ncbi:PAS domain S-box protein [Mariprofundus erugo]|uniref:histidine kinase n=2 Tax=Mariprofundus erugo TaxID=2528639 RepID=A0A5R9GJY9_9PROT|nr:PAS domain S-box protein [Mariprofundus erugo]
MPAEDITTVMSRDITTATADISAAEAAVLISKSRQKCIIITAGGFPAGLLTAADICAVVAQGHHPLTTTIADIPLSPVTTLPADTPCHQIADLPGQDSQYIVVDQQNMAIGLIDQATLCQLRKANTEARLAEQQQELRQLTSYMQKKDQLDHIISHIPVVHYACRYQSGSFIPYYVSANIETLFGYTATDYMENGTWWQSILHPDDVEHVLKRFGEAMLAGQHEFSHEYRIRKKGGSLVWIRDDVNLVHNQAGALTEIIGSWLDISEQKLRQYEFESVVEASFDALIVHRHGIILFANKAALHLIGARSTAEIIGTPIQRYLHPDDYTRAIERLQSLTPGGAPLPPTVERYLRLDGDTIEVEVSTALFQYNGEAAFLSAGRDISERKQAELLLKRSEEKFRTIIDASPVALAVSDCHQHITLLNRAFVDLFGYTQDDIPSLQHWWPLAYPDPAYRRQVEQSWQAAIASIHQRTAGHTPMEFRVTCKDGTIRDIQFIVTAMGESCLTIMNDLTARKQAENLARKMLQAIEQAGESILMTDAAGIIEYVNPAFSELTGYSCHEAVGQTLAMLQLHDQNSPLFEQMWNTISHGETWSDKAIEYARDGHPIPVMLTISPVRNESGIITSYVGIQQDLSAYESLEQQFHQAQKMEAIGTLVGGIAHDFNNMLAGITGNLFLVRHRLENHPQALEKLANVEELTFRASDMIRQLLTYARRDKVSMRALPLAPFIKETLKFLRTVIPENIELHQYISLEHIMIHGDGTQLHQVLMNLINNARDALEEIENPIISVRLELFQPDHSFIKKHRYFREGSYARLIIADNGAGIAAEHLPHIFEPFFTTKELGKGTGLGLAMVYGAIKTHRGFIEVTSNSESGTHFDIYLPALTPETGTTGLPTADKMICGHGETILLADDEAQILQTGKAVLKSLGYQVLTAGNGKEAVELFCLHADTIALCMLDIVMPVMGGDAAAEKIRAIRPDMPVIFVSGYDKLNHTDTSSETILTKPCPVTLMSREIHQALHPQQDEPQA